MSTEAQDNFYLAAEEWLTAELVHNPLHVAALPLFPSSQGPWQEPQYFAVEGKDASFGDELVDMSSSGSSMISASHAAAATDDLTPIDNVKSPPPYSLDFSKRALCKKVTLNEAMMHQAIQKLGGGEMALKILMDHVWRWVGQRTVCNTQQISISDSLQQLCFTPPATSSYTPTLDSTRSPPTTNLTSCLQSDCTSGAGDLETSPAASFYGAQPGCQAPKPKWQQQRMMQEAAPERLQEHDVNHKKRKRSAVCATGVGMDSSLHTGSAHNFRSGRDQFGDTREPLRYGKLSASCNSFSAPSSAAKRAARKHRMACQRLSKSYEAANAAASYNSSNNLAMQRSAAGSPPAVESLSAHVAKKLEPIMSSGFNKQSGNPFTDRHKGTSTGTLVMLLHKFLQPSDVSSLGRIVLPKKEAESCLPYLAVKEGMLLTMEDFYTGKTWKVRYRYWPNNRSRMYLIENTGAFVRSHQLEEGDLLILYKNVEHNKIVIRGKKNAQPEGIAPAVTDKNLACMTKDLKVMPIPKLDTKQRVAMKQGEETADDQTNSQLKVKMRCAISAAFETASPKVEWAQFEDPSELGNLMQGLIRDDKQYGTCGLAGWKNPEQLVRFPSLEFGDLLMEDDVARVACKVNLPASICKIEPE